MKRYARLTAFLLAAAMLLGLFAGCGVTRGEDTEESTEAIRGDLTTGGLTLSQNEAGKKLIAKTTRAPGDVTVKSYTIMVYMVGSDLESNYGCASSDLLEMLDSGLLGSNANLVVYTGGCTSWELNIRSDVNTVYALTDDGTTLEEVASTNQSANMGDAGTLLDFLDFTYANYPAEKYGLICWDHGGGPLYGFGSDQLFDSDGLGLWEMELALENSPFAEEKLEFIGFDACLMATLEVAYSLSEYAEYLIASEEVEPGNGWDYSFLRTLNETDDTRTLMKSILESYQIAMEADFWRPEYTLSCVSLIMVYPMLKCMEQLWERMRGDVTGGDFSAIARSRDDTKRFGMSAVSDRGSSFDLVDVGDMIQKLGDDYKDLNKKLMDYLEIAVVEQVSNVEGTTGLSMYYPYDNKTLYQYGGYAFEYGELMNGYQEFLEAYAQQWLYGSSGIRWSQEQSIQAEEGCLTLQLEQEQLEHLGSVTYTVMQYDEETDGYSAILTGFEATPDENGVISIPRNPDVYMMYTDTYLEGEEGCLWPVTLVESGMTKNNYVSYSSCLVTSLDFIVGSVEPIQITLADDLQTGEVVIQSILGRDQTDSEFYGRQDVSIDNWGIVAYNWNPIYPTYDLDGQLLPWSEWETDGSFWYTFCNYEESFHFEKTQLRDLEGRFYCQVVMTDSSGNVIGTRLEELYVNTPYEEQTVTAAEGAMTFRVYEDHAELVAFEENGDGDWFTCLELTVTVPGTVGGVPVTVIGPETFENCQDIIQVKLPDSVTDIGYSAFTSCYHLTQVNIPASIRTIGNQAFGWVELTEVTLPEGLEILGYQSFAGTEITEVTLPASVKLVGAGAFAYCDSLTAIHVAAGNTAYKSVDGVLFSADGTCLTAFPTAWGEKYDVPAGVEIIGDEAFRGNEILTTLNLPEGLLVIDRLAFCDTFHLLNIDLPESLEVIGNAAFGNSLYETPVVDIPALNIGANVRWVGYEAFNGYNIQAFRVAEDNENYSSANGCLLNASGTRLIQAPYGYAGELAVPEGVSYIAWAALEGCNGITSLILPDSLVGINHASGIPSRLEKLVVGKGLTDWQNVTKFFSVAEIEISPENPNYTITEDGSIYTKDMTKLLLCRSEAEEFVIPDGVTEIHTGALQSLYGDAATMKSIYIPASVETIPETAFVNLMALEKIEVAADNPNFASYDGLLYTKDGKTLLASPIGRTGTVEVREGTVEIGAYAFAYGGNLKAEKIILPEGVTTIRYGNFTSSPYNSVISLYLPESLTTIHQETFAYANADRIIVYCVSGSAADTYAREMGMTVVNN